MSPEDRAREGIFMAFQYPVEIPGVSNLYFLKAALNAIRKHQGQPDLDAMDFLALVKRKNGADGDGSDSPQSRRQLRLFRRRKEAQRDFSDGRAGTKLAILDETDSGLDIDALKIVANGVNALRGPERAMIVVTHYQRLLNYIVPDYVHVLAEGRIVKSGGKELALELEETGYAGWNRPRGTGHDREGGSDDPKIREEARRRFAELGFPTTHDEDWRFTSVAPISRTSFASSGRPPGLSAALPPPESRSPSSPRPPSNSYLARYASFRDNAFVALNTANFEDGLFIHIAKGAVIEEPIEIIVRVLRQRPSHRQPPAHPNRSGTRSQATIIEHTRARRTGPVPSPLSPIR